MNSSLRTALLTSTLALMATTLPVSAQSHNEIHLPTTIAEQVLAARSKQRIGEYKAARDILLSALSKEPNSASLLNALGSVQQNMGEYLEAERSYLHALSASASTEGDPERVTILNNLGTLYLDTNQYSKSEQIREQLEELPLGTLERHRAQAGALLNVIASLEHVRNRDDEAERYYLRSLVLLREAHGSMSVDAALVEGNLGFVRLEARQYESAAGLFRRAIREIEAASGPEDPELIRPLANLARCENMNAQPNQAEPIARRAVELSVKSFGEAHPVTTTAMLEQATSLRSLRRKKLARDLEKRAKALLQHNAIRNLSGYTVTLRDLARFATR